MPPADATRLVEEAYRAWNAAGPGAFVEFATQDVEVHDPPELPDAQTWSGREAVVGRLEDVVATTGGTWADIDDVRAVGDEVLVSLTWRMEREARRRWPPSTTSSESTATASRACASSSRRTPRFRLQAADPA